MARWKVQYYKDGLWHTYSSGHEHKATAENQMSKAKSEKKGSNYRIQLG